MGNILVRTNNDIKRAVKMWCNDPVAAEKKYGHISDWDVSRVTKMKKLFENCYDFNDDIGRWDVSNVITMQNMFTRSNFNRDIGKWNVSNVTNMAKMFFDATSFTPLKI